VVLTALTVAGAVLALRSDPLLVAAGVVLLAAMYTHAVELQHQCLHHSAFRRSLPHRIVGVPLGIPLFVVYSHYRLRHLQHHRYLGTPQDTEFFGFDTRGPLTWPALMGGFFDYKRLGSVVLDVLRSATGRWTYSHGTAAPAMYRRIVVDHLALGAVLLICTGTAFAGYGEYLLRLWVLPLLLAVPLHFLVELPEHILCDTESTDVLRNTRSIRGSWFSTWYTNGNNLHIEHHASMAVPINRLHERHGETLQYAEHVERSYPDFFRLLRRAMRDTRKAPSTATTAGDSIASVETCAASSPTGTAPIRPSKPQKAHRYS
jgi:fatty acid desaturase